MTADMLADLARVFMLESIEAPTRDEQRRLYAIAQRLEDRAADAAMTRIIVPTRRR